MENLIQKIYQRHDVYVNQKEAAKKRKEAIDISIARKEKEEKELYEKLKAKYENGTGI